MHGCIYNLQDELLRDLNTTVNHPDEAFTMYYAAGDLRNYPTAFRASDAAFSSRP